ncbi:MAG: restriction endonuclease subunit S [Mariniphaga sp.]
MMTENHNLPKHWKKIKLGAICKFVRGPFGGSLKKENFKTDGFAIYEQQHAIYNQFSNIRYFIEESKFNEMSRFELKSGDLIMSCSGTMGKVAIVPKNIKKGIINQALLKLSPSQNVSNTFLKIWMQSGNFQDSLKSFSKGAAIQNVASVSVLKDMEILLPPLPEQLAIVSRIEELLSDLENGKQQLIIAQQQLKIYRQSLLKWAFEGKLTNKVVKDGELPKGWKWVTLSEVCHKIGDIDHKMPKQLPSGYPYVSTKDFTDNLKISFDNAKFISEEDYLSLGRKIKPERGDIIFPRYGTIGKNILIDFDKEFLVSYSCAVVKPNQKFVLSKYVYLYTLSPKITEEIRKYTVETTQANVGIASIKSFIFPLPPLSEQQLIVDELESKLTVCDKIEETISQSLLQAESLRQSILKKAFEGKLVKHQ